MGKSENLPQWNKKLVMPIAKVQGVKYSSVQNYGVGKIYLILFYILFMYVQYVCMYLFIYIFYINTLIPKRCIKLIKIESNDVSN